jgi:hypothetical protein
MPLLYLYKTFSGFNRFITSKKLPEHIVKVKIKRSFKYLRNSSLFSAFLSINFFNKNLLV